MSWRRTGAKTATSRNNGGGGAASSSRAMRPPPHTRSSLSLEPPVVCHHLSGTRFPPSCQCVCAPSPMPVRASPRFTPPLPVAARAPPRCQCAPPPLPGVRRYPSVWCACGVVWCGVRPCATVIRRPALRCARCDKAAHACAPRHLRAAAWLLTLVPHGICALRQGCSRCAPRHMRAAARLLTLVPHGICALR